MNCLFTAGHGNALNKLLLEDQVQNHHGDHGQQAACHQHREVGGVLTVQGGKTGRQGHHVQIGVADQRPHQVSISEHRRKDGQCRHAGAGQRQHDLDEGLPLVAAVQIQEMRSLIASMPQTTGATVLISSHLLGEIEQMVDQVGILNHGKLLFEGSLQQLQKHSRGGILLRVLDAPKAAAVLQQQGVKATAPADQPDTLQLPPLPDEALAALVCTLAESGVGVVGLAAQTKSLEDIFLSLTQTSGEVA